jgi:hypothetical protein
VAAVGGSEAVPQIAAYRGDQSTAAGLATDLPGGQSHAHYLGSRQCPPDSPLAAEVNELRKQLPLVLRAVASPEARQG